MNADEDITTIIKQYAGITICIALTLYFIYWIYQNIIKDPLPQQNNANTNASGSALGKGLPPRRKMTINMKSIMPQYLQEDLSNEASLTYQLLEQLNDQHELFLILLINDNDNKQEILAKFAALIENKILYQHRILFCTTVEGLCAMVRSIDPFVHIEGEEFVICNLIRYINEFWFMKSKDSDFSSISDKVKRDKNNINVNHEELMKKVKFYDNINGLMANN